MVKYRKFIVFLLRAMFVLGLVGIFFMGLRVGYDEEIIYYFNGYVVILVSYAVMSMVFINVYGGLRVGALRLGSLVFSCMIAILLANFLIYLVLSLIAYKLLSVWPISLVTAAQCGFAVIGCWYINRVYYALRSARQVVAIYNGDANDELTVLKMQSIRERYQIVGVVDAAKSVDEILRALEPYESVLIGTIGPEKRAELLARCYREGKRINIIPSTMDIVLNSAQQTQVLDTPVLLCRNQELTPEQDIIKRGMDIMLSLIGLIIASPLMVFTALAIRLHDGGPVFYKQKRLTKDGKEFSVIKFRSMVVDAEKGMNPGYLLAEDADPRITGIGHVLRRTRMDELPQIFNILKGDMSIVGPRPERPEVYKECRETLPDFDLRLRVRAGLTGFAQIYGRYNTPLRDKLNMDLVYIGNFSILQDIRLILMTIKIVFLKESTQAAIPTESAEAAQCFHEIVAEVNNGESE